MKKITQRELFLIGAILFVCGLLAALGLWLSYAVYVQRSDQPVVRRVGAWLPIARVGSRTVRYSEFVDARDTISVYLQSDAAKSAGLAGPLTKEVEKNAFDRILREALVEQIAQDKHIQVSDPEVREAFQSLIESSSSTIGDVSRYLDQTFHWNEDQFRFRVVRPALLEERVAAIYASSTDEQRIFLEQDINKRRQSPQVKIYLKF